MKRPENDSLIRINGFPGPEYIHLTTGEGEIKEYSITSSQVKKRTPSRAGGRGKRKGNNETSRVGIDTLQRVFDIVEYDDLSFPTFESRQTLKIISKMKKNFAQSQAYEHHENISIQK